MGGIHIGVWDKHAKLKFLVGVISLKFVYRYSRIIPRVVYGDILEFWRLNTYKKKASEGLLRLKNWSICPGVLF